MRFSAIKRISEGAYFLVDFRNFTNTLTQFNLVLANQTISSGFEGLMPEELYELWDDETQEDKEELGVPTFDSIVQDPEICMGEPHIRGTRITVAFVCRLFESGMQVKEILEAYPSLQEEDVRQAIAFSQKFPRESTP